MVAVALYLLAAIGCALCLAVHNEAHPPTEARPAIHAAFGLVWWMLVIALAALVMLRFVRVRWR